MKSMLDMCRAQCQIPETHGILSITGVSPVAPRTIWLECKQLCQILLRVIIKLLNTVWSRLWEDQGCDLMAKYLPCKYKPWINPWHNKTYLKEKKKKIDQENTFKGERACFALGSPKFGPQVLHCFLSSLSSQSAPLWTPPDMLPKKMVMLACPESEGQI